MSRALWIPDVCRRFGLEVIEVDGWRSRGKDTLVARGVVCHHTGGPATGDMPTLRILINGRSDLPGPLCNVGLSRSGKVYVIASGKANHAGTGGWQGLKGNSSVLGIEAENNGGQPWPAQQVDAYIRLAAALAHGAPCASSKVCGHKEWAPGRKPDPHSIDMVQFRIKVQRLLSGSPNDPPPQPVLTFNDPEGIMERRVIPAESGSDGKGWLNTNLPFSRFVTAQLPGSYPPVDGYWPVGEWAVQDRGGNAVITFTGVRPNAKFGLVVWSAQNPV